jgi:hypothetical protein
MRQLTFQRNLLLPAVLDSDLSICGMMNWSKERMDKGERGKNRPIYCAWSTFRTYLPQAYLFSAQLNSPEAIVVDSM